MTPRHCLVQYSTVSFFSFVENYGYTEIIKIPTGATQLKVKDTSNNYLGRSVLTLMNSVFGNMLFLCQLSSRSRAPVIIIQACQFLHLQVVSLDTLSVLTVTVQRNSRSRPMSRTPVATTISYYTFKQCLWKHVICVDIFCAMNENQG